MSTETDPRIGDPRIEQWLTDRGWISDGVCATWLDPLSGTNWKETENAMKKYKLAFADYNRAKEKADWAEKKAELMRRAKEIADSLGAGKPKP